MVWPTASPITKVLQYYSFLLTGLAPRLRLIWSRCYTSFDEWAEKEPEALESLRICITVAHSWCVHRFWQGSLVSPWMFAALIDFRRALPERHMIRDHLFNLSIEQLDEWFGLPLVQMFESAEGLMEKLCMKALWLWAWEVYGTAAPVEFCHGRNGSRLHPNMVRAARVYQMINKNRSDNV